MMLMPRRGRGRRTGELIQYRRGTVEILSGLLRDSMAYKLKGKEAKRRQEVRCTHSTDESGIVTGGGKEVQR